MVMCMSVIRTMTEFKYFKFCILNIFVSGLSLTLYVICLYSK